MAETKQGDFNRTYHHLEAPTVQDAVLWERRRKRKLIIPSASVDPKIYRDPLYYQLSNTDWQFKRKLNGANLRVSWNGEQALWNGKSNNFVCSAELTEYMNETFLEEIFEEKFGRECEVYLFGEHMGQKVQGNELKLFKDEFILYDVCINDFWQSPESIIAIANYFGIHTCYDFMPQMDDECDFSDTLFNLINRAYIGDFKGWEGIVATPMVECRTQHGNRVIVKIKNKDYLSDEVA